MVPLSTLNEAQVRALFAAGDVDAALGLLGGCTVSDHATLLERIRSAAARASGGGVNELKEALALAVVDWRDLLVAAEFADDVEAHLHWAPQRLDADVVNNWMGGAGLRGVLYGLNESVQIHRLDGSLVQGAVVGLTRLEPSPRYVVELDDGYDVETWQHDIVS